MKRVSLFSLGFMLFALSNSLKASHCEIDEKYLKANYQLSQQVQKPITQHQHLHQSNASHAISTQLLSLYRYNNQVIHAYPEQGRGDWWTKTANDRLMLNRFFTAQARVIEYQANEINEKSDWFSKFNLIKDEHRAAMTLDETTGKGCQKEEHFTLTTGNVRYQLTWLSELSLVKSYQVFMDDKPRINWQLLSYYPDKNKVDQFVQQLSTYQSTDYADIGDNENDPFLAKMINQGFIEHEQTGFYNSQGDNISHQHNH